MGRELAQGLRFTLLTMALLGGAYHACLWTIGRAAFPRQVDGSLLRRADGTPVGSALIAQRFDGPGYFHPRPSAVDYDAAAASASHLGPFTPVHLDTVAGRLSLLTAEDRVAPAVVPSEMVTASGSGLDPHIPLAAAELQAARVAAARGVPSARVHDLVHAHIESPALGVLGRDRVNVLVLNLALDAALGEPVRRARR